MTSSGRSLGSLAPIDWGRFGGNKRARIYGRLDCPSALAAIKRGRTYQQHRVFFADEASALAAGFRACARCMREAYERWRAANAARGSVRHRD
ncbi:MAG: Ada metal-binding domain-containing protein [Xanthobacteraceae bacterium]